MSSEGIPYSCPKCRDEGSPTGALVFGKDAEIPQCKYHPGTRFERSIYFDADGRRVIAAPVFKEVDTQ